MEPAFPAGALLLLLTARRNIAVILVLDAVGALLLGLLLRQRRLLLARVTAAGCTAAARVLLGLQLARVRCVFIFGCPALLCLLLWRRRVFDL